ncbi:carnosic acid synthase-like [Salvia hispanica]|uniref:carnosic acid synthase-like n=1 Tax=Salvia hispanica TaxID=49212 RepID=UPI002008FEA3|nr:carnosic acid synthase-like [Salvia hispanica]
MVASLFLVFSLAFIAAWALGLLSRRGHGGNLPPGPRPLPIVGNIFQLRGNPLKSLADLAKTYGPLMSLRFGTQLVVIVSSPEVAMEVLHKQGHTFSSRSLPAAVNIYGFNKALWTMMPADSAPWKRFRKMGKEKLFSNEALHQTEWQRQETLQRLAKHVRGFSERGEVMNVGAATFTTMTDLVLSTLFSIHLTDYTSPDSAMTKDFKANVNAFSRYIGIPNVSDFFPVLAPLDLQGIRRKIGYHLKKLLDFVDDKVDKRKVERMDSDYRKKNDFLDTLLDLADGAEYELTKEEISLLLADLIIAGTETSGAMAEWTMVELLLHPDKMAKVKAELKSVLRDKSIAEASDIAKLPYLQATVNEAFRYHPPSPLVGPREAREVTKVNGYTIPKKTRVLVNFWAITKDPRIWKNPEVFEPERFLGTDIDFEGQHFQLIPFGSGIRICPGLPLASRMLFCMVATLCHNFDWELPGGVESKVIEREDVFGLSLQKKVSLRAKPKPIKV